MMAALRTKSGPNTAWKAGWVPSNSWDGAPAMRKPAAQATARKALYRPAQGATHPLADPGVDADLARREAEIDGGFARLADVLEKLAPHQFDEGFADRAVSDLAAIGVFAEPGWFRASWTRPLDMGAIHARCVARLFSRMVQTGTEAVRHACSDGEPVDELIRRWGFHAVDITPCADGRLAGLLGSVLRVPLSVVTARRSYAGAMFPVSGALQDWEKVELGRWRTGSPNAADADTKYLKIGVYHFSSVDPGHHGCAAHGSDDARAVAELMQRLIEFKGAVESRHDAGDQVALLLVGLDTDTDAIRVHVPDELGYTDTARYVDALALHADTAGMARDAAKDAVRDAVAASMGVGRDDAATEGMRWFCGYLLKNNIAQVEAVLQRFAGPYPEAGHAEKLIVIGDPVDDVQLRNLAFQAQMTSVEEGAGDLAVGVKILGGRLWGDGLAVPVLVLRTFCPELPGDEAAAAAAALRMAAAVQTRFGDRPVTFEVALRACSGGEMKFLNRNGSADPAGGRATT